jgi:hypothetical protein
MHDKTLPELHNLFLDAYKALCSSGWASGPDDGYFFQNLPYHLVEAQKYSDLCALLLDYDWMTKRLKATNISVLIADYETLPVDNRDKDLSLIHESLKLSRHALSRDHTQLSSQLLGRLGGLGQTWKKIGELLKGARRGPGVAWLCPVTATLTPPGEPLMETGRIPIFPVKLPTARGENWPYVSTGSTVRLCSRLVA